MSLIAYLAVACPPTGAAAFYIYRLRRRLAAATFDATHDPLTGVYNRRPLAAAITDTADRGRPFALLLCEIDRFKDINELLGHTAGDAVLVELAQRLTQLGPAVTAVFRLGGDEFAVLMNGDQEQTLAAARKAWQAIADHPFTDPDGRQITVYASIGTVTHQPGIDAAILLRQADDALRQAKPTGTVSRFPIHTSTGPLHWPQPHAEPSARRRPDDQPPPKHAAAQPWYCWFDAADIQPLAQHAATSRWHHRSDSEEALIRDCPGGLAIWTQNGRLLACSTGYPTQVHDPHDPHTLRHAEAIHANAAPDEAGGGPPVAHIHLDAEAVDAIARAADWGGLLEVTVTGDHATFTLTRPGLQSSSITGRP